MAYHLWSVDKTKGDSGPLSKAIEWNGDGTPRAVVSNRPTVGCSMLVGSPVARAYVAQDYLLTTPVIEILVDEPNYVRFKTRNTEYEWRIG